MWSWGNFCSKVPQTLTQKCLAGVHILSYRPNTDRNILICAAVIWNWHNIYFLVLMLFALIPLFLDPTQMERFFLLIINIGCHFNVFFYLPWFIPPSGYSAPILGKFNFYDFIHSTSNESKSLPRFFNSLFSDNSNFPKLIKAYNTRA